MDNEPTVLFRKRDIKDLEKRVKELGCEMRFNPNYGSGVSDLNYDMPPYVDAPHIKLEIEDYIATSVGLIIKKS